MLTFILILIINYLIFILDFELIYTSAKGRITSIEYNGLLWVLLDRWLDWYYDIDWRPLIQWVQITRT